jgi:hypothetical protein
MWLFSGQPVDRHGRSPPPMSLADLVATAGWALMEAAQALQKK